MTCPDCGGSGELEERDDDGGTFTVQCSRCEGSGEINPDLERWEYEVNRGIERHRERFVDW